VRWPEPSGGIIEGMDAEHGEGGDGAATPRPTRSEGASSSTTGSEADGSVTVEPVEVLGPSAAQDLVALDGAGGDGDGDRTESIEQPAKVLRIGSMLKQLLDEVRAAPLDEASRVRLKQLYEQSVRELASGLSPDLVAELNRLVLPFGEATPSEAELRVAQAQLVGWLEGLFQGIQAALMAQQMAARAQLQEMRQRGLPPGNDIPLERPGTYL
jgi:hypothetical protein